MTKVTLNNNNNPLKISLNGKKPNKVVVQNNDSTQSVSINKENSEKIHTIAIGKPAAKLAELNDVDASDPDNGEVVVYDESSGKYIVKTIPRIDGGRF